MDEFLDFKIEVPLTGFGRKENGLFPFKNIKFEAWLKNIIVVVCVVVIFPQLLKMILKWFGILESC